MTDIVERLRAPAYWFSGSSEGHEGENSAPLEAARTIEILRVELARINMENDRLTRTNRTKREHRDKLLAAGAKAADEIERFKASLADVVTQTQEQADEIERLRTALQECLGWHDYSNDMHKPIEVRAAYMRARAALEGK